MAVGITLLNSNGLDNITTNFERVEAALQDVIGRSGTTPNNMSADLDMDSNDVLNVNRIDVQEFYMNGQPIASIPAFEAIVSIAPEIVIVAGISTEVVSVAANEASIALVGSNITNINTVATNVASVNTVATDIANINTVAANIVDIDTVVANIVDIQNAEENALLAKGYATEAEDVPVEVAPDRFSALHWAAKALASAASAAAAVTGAVKANVVQAFTPTEQWQARANIGLDLGYPLLHVRDEKPSGTAGGVSTSTTTHTRTLNTVIVNEITGASLSSNQVTLPAGTYEVSGSAPAFLSSGHRTRLRDITNGTTLVLGRSAHSSATGSAYGGSSTHSDLVGRFTLVGTVTIELQHYITAGYASLSRGLGGEVGSGEVEIYADLQIRKVK